MAVRTRIDIEQLAELREVRGLTYGQISRKIGMSVGAISWMCLKHGIEKPGKPTRLCTERPGQTHARGGHVVRRFTEEEDAKLLELSAQGASVATMSKAIGRPHNSTIGRLMTLGRRQEREAS